MLLIDSVNSTLLALSIQHVSTHAYCCQVATFKHLGVSLELPLARQLKNLCVCEVSYIPLVR